LRRTAGAGDPVIVPGDPRRLCRGGIDRPRLRWQRGGRGERSAPLV